jgi:hypothetical protein
VAADFEVQMRPGGVAGVAHCADNLATVDRLPFHDVNVAQVGIIGSEAIGVIDDD